MAEEKLYTQDDINRLRDGWESDLFEQKTLLYMQETNRRLDQSNAYKETFGKDLIEIKSDMKDFKIRLLTLENIRLNDQRERFEADKQKKQRLQDRQARIVGYGSLVLWGLSLFLTVGPRIVHGIGYALGLT